MFAYIQVNDPVCATGKSFLWELHLKLVINEYYAGMASIKIDIIEMGFIEGYVGSTSSSPDPIGYV